MGQRCTKEQQSLPDNDNSEATTSENIQHDYRNYYHPSHQNGTTSSSGRSTPEGRSTGQHNNMTQSTSNNFRESSTSSTIMSNEFRRKESREGHIGTGSKRPVRASNYNDIHIQVSEQLMQFEEKNQQRALNGYQPMGVVGLQNLGNTCFLNSSIQCLSATIPLTDYFLGYDYKSEINKTNFLGTGGKLVTAYAQLLKEMWLGNKSVVRPVQFKKQLSKFAPQFSGTYQHDAQELLSFLLDGIHEDLNRVKDKPYVEDRDCDGKNDEVDAIEAWKNYLRRNKSLIVDLFQGQLRNTCRCNHCGHKNIRFEPFMYLSLPISDSCRTLQDCLDLYVSTDELRGDNRWYCEKCKKHRDGTKKIDLWILPPILIVHLKRFKYNEYGHVGSKNTANIQFPLEGWDLSDAVKSRGSVPPVYDLYAVSNHIGGLRSGHYTAFSLTRFDEQWVEFNDSHPRAISPETVIEKSASAYVLFYNRANTENASQMSEGSVESSAASARYPMVRRQSVTRPDLWPHTQVDSHRFREYSRQSKLNSSMRSLNDSFRSPPVSPMVGGSKGTVTSMMVGSSMPSPPIASFPNNPSRSPREEKSSSRKRSTRSGKKSSSRYR